MYELRDQAWFDRGTGHCKGVYDDQNDVALLIVEAEDALDESRQADDPEGPGGFLKDELLLNAQVSKDDVYTRQQGNLQMIWGGKIDLTRTETLIVWTDQATQQDIALSFQDPEGCEDIWQFLMEVQKHLNNQLGRFAAGPLGHALTSIYSLFIFPFGSFPSPWWPWAGHALSGSMAGSITGQHQVCVFRLRRSE